MHVAEAAPPRPPNVKQHALPAAQFAEPVHDRAAPPWHCPVAVHVGAPPLSGAQQTCVAVWHVEAPHTIVPPPLLLLADPLLLDPDAPLLLLLDEDPEPLLLEADPDPPLLDPDAEPDPPLEPDPVTDASVKGSTPGITGTVVSRGLREPHAIRSKAESVESSFVGFMDCPSMTVALSRVSDRPTGRSRARIRHVDQCRTCECTAPARYGEAGVGAVGLGGWPPPPIAPMPPMPPIPPGKPRGGGAAAIFCSSTSNTSIPCGAWGCPL
jgi:hypothetical protein